MTSIHTDAISYYSTAAQSFHDSYRTDPNRLERLRVWKNYLDRYARGATFAYDIGCGSGILACELAERGIETIGIDGAPGMLAIGREAALRAGLRNLTFQQHSLPITNTREFRSADLIISSSALEYLDSIHDALVSVRDLLKPGGIVVFSVSNRDSWSRLAVRFVNKLTGRPRYLGLLKHFMTVEKISQELASAKLDYVEHAFFARADRINRLLGRFLPPRIASNMIIVVAQRI
jgi:SAM-dependent methyltransferase